jgi:L-threonylcarbamoyladenylate synthase
MTRVLVLDPIQPDLELIAEAAAVIRAGGLVAFPTETVYGLGADGLSLNAVEKIFAAKQRPSSDPLILHLSSLNEIERVASIAPELEQIVSKLAREFWPGPLTLVLPKLEQVPNAVTANGPSVAVRVPAHLVALELIRAADTPIAAPSANLFSRPSPTSAGDVLEDLRGRINMVLDAGPTRIGVESTVLSLISSVPTLLRPGGLSLESLEAVIGPVMLPGEAVVADGVNAPAPGMLLKHYSPRARLECLMGASGPALLEALRERAESLRHEKLGLLLPDSSLKILEHVQAEKFSLGESLETYAARMFQGMRALDRAGVTVILTHGFEPSGLGRALNDRLFRASEGHITLLEP